MKVIFEYFEKFKVFKKLSLGNYNFHQKEKFYRCLKLKQYKKGETIFDYGDEADYFYFIIKGKASIHIPTIVKKKFTSEEYLDYMQHNNTSTNRSHMISEANTQ